ncbi:pyridoxamine 5'-phosphate oxidase family protein [Streptacidiphilus fuscans]|uniref:Pyridoxamine 5'-phosphate oxidase family protein n=1 Tax=Streptacidiphilus fuscans TaxID=2789292 RepID=A0A931FDV2_9ACTN|nr:pyridoxamine 5'-phosphate oxidase family protein [Streptacidiphilus fuscans]MBF9068001.1 pyridoxamine 5'-phosphate oxidase family protein [Streptacidiphilus fuscans]
MSRPGTPPPDEPRPDEPRPDAALLDAALLDALRAHTTLTLAYADADGPQACAVLYAIGADASLVFVTAATTRHGRALSVAPAVPVAFTAQADGQEWTALTGVQGRGVCRRLADGPERDAAWRAYTERHPFVTADPRLQSALESTALWAIHPTWLRLIDNSRGFATKLEWQSPPES